MTRNLNCFTITMSYLGQRYLFLSVSLNGGPKEVKNARSADKIARQKQLRRSDMTYST